MVGTALAPVAQMQSLTDRMARFARQEGLFRGVQRLLVAVSGGPDSLATLLCLKEMAPDFSFDVTAAHFDHQLRPDSADDLAFVREFCAARDIPFLSGEGDVREAAGRNRAGIEETARRMRYQFLGFVAGEKRMDAVATGHTRDDQAETVLMRVLRGSGVRGIRGMLPSSDLPGSARRLVRPMLFATRAETEACCTAASLTPRRDPSNDDPAPTRNRLRHEVLPSLASINPAVSEALVRLGGNAREVFAGVERESFSAHPIVRGPVGTIFAIASLRALQGEALVLVLEREAAFARATFETNHTRIANLRSALARGSGSARFGDVVAEVSCGKVRVGPALAWHAAEPRVLNVPGVTVVGDWRVDLKTSELDALAGASLGRVWPASVTGALRGRALQPGDRIRYHGIERKVADLFSAEKVPAWDRGGAFCIAGAAHVHLVFTAGGVFEADSDGGEPWFVRVTSARA